MRVPGKPLSWLAALLLGASAAGAVGIAATADLRIPPPADPPAFSAADPADRSAAAAELAAARAAEAAGDVARALSRYRAAAERDPRVMDTRSPSFPGPAFEENLKGWIAGLKSGKIPGGPRAAEDAAVLFRRMYGGCG